MSQRLTRFALLASFSSLFSYSSRVLAQIPVFEVGAPTPDSPAPAPLTPPAVVPAPAPLTPSAAAPPSAASPLDKSAPPPAPAKAAVISAPDATRGAEARVEPEPELEPSEDDELDLAPQRRWYGWQTLVADGANLGVLLLGTALAARSESGDTLVGVGLLGYEFAPGIVHFTHRNVGRGFASFGIRLGMPLAGAFLGASLASGCNTNLCEASGAGVGILLGMGGAVAIDAAVFAYDDRKRASARRLGIVPLVSVTPRQAWLGFGGQL